MTKNENSGWSRFMFTTNLLYIFFSQLLGLIFDVIRSALGV